MIGGGSARRLMRNGFNASRTAAARPAAPSSALCHGSALSGGAANGAAHPGAVPSSTKQCRMRRAMQGMQQCVVDIVDVTRGALTPSADQLLTNPAALSTATSSICTPASFGLIRLHARR